MEKALGVLYGIRLEVDKVDRKNPDSINKMHDQMKEIVTSGSPMLTEYQTRRNLTQPFSGEL